MGWNDYKAINKKMRRTIQTPHGLIKLEYEGGDVYRAPLSWFPGREYMVFHDRQQTQFKVVFRYGKRGDVIGFGKDIDEACEIILAHAEFMELKERSTDTLDYD
jgi:hypothetical protein